MAEIDRFTQNSKTDSQPKTRVYGYRHVILLLFSIGAIINNISNYIYLPLQTTMARVFNLNQAWIAFFTNYISNLTYLPAVPVANYLADKKGLKVATFAGVGVTLFSWWLCVGVKSSFTWLVVGQAISGFGFPFFNMPQKLSAVWYANDERDFATSIFNIFYQISASIGALISQVFVPSDVNSLPDDVVQNDIFEMLLWTSIITTAFSIPIYLFFRTAPPTPPSQSAEKEDDSISIRDLLKNRNYNFLLAGSSITVASYLGLVGNIETILSPYGIGENQVSYMVSLGVITACLGSFLMGIYISKAKKYKGAYLLSSLGSTAVLVFMWLLTWKFANPWITGGLYCLYQFILSASLPLSWEFLIEIAYPAGAATAGSLMMSIAQQLAAVIGLVLAALLNNQFVSVANECFVISIVIQLSGGIFVLFVDESLMRLKYEQLSLLNRRKTSWREIRRESMFARNIVYIPRDIVFDRSSNMGDSQYLTAAVENS